MTIERIIGTLKGKDRYAPRIEHIEVLPPSEPTYGDLGKELPASLKRYLQEKGIRLYQHQCEAIESLRDGKNVIITTPTASGKTLAFNLPIFEQLSHDRNATALYMYPTKALSNDQLKVIIELERVSGIRVNPDIYDGDTPTNRRPRIRTSSRIIITNPYEVHQILPWHYKWSKFLKNLKFIVIDEAHQYRGVFGSNVAYLIRRLRKICNFYGSHPQFILSTATLANPIEFSENLIGLSCHLIAQDSSPKGKKYFILYNPFYNGVGELSTHNETKDLFLFFVKQHLQTLCFTVSRKMAELILLWSKKEFEESDSYLLDKITSYRAGYLPEERREIENNLKNGTLIGITSTNALELGIDVGSLDSVIISGYPGTIISTWQQAGRAGRGVGESIATLVAFQNPMDQYFMKHPDVFFGKPNEHAIIDLSNPYINTGHMMCATSELPIRLPEDKEYLGDVVEDYLRALEVENLVRRTPNGWVYSGKGRATEAVNLHNIPSEIFKVIYDGKLLETMDRPQAYREGHAGAILLHQGETYVVEEMDLKNSIIKVTKSRVDYYTQAMKIVNVSIIDENDKRKCGDLTVFTGDVEVTEEYMGYKIMKYDNVIGIEPLHLPPLHFKTKGLWFNVSGEIKKMITDKGLDFGGGLHGLEHAMIGMMPFHVMCDRWDIGGVSATMHPDTLQPTIIIYDGFEGGIGLSEKAAELFEAIVNMTHELVKDCPCDGGCPACILSPKCGNENDPMDKIAAVLILEEMQKLMP